LISSRHARRHSGARPQALNPESRHCLALFFSNKLGIPGSIANALARVDDCPGMTIEARWHGTRWRNELCLARRRMMKPG
jgi:hypothetical protein